MKATELRLGNWVLASDNYKEKYPLIVEEIRKHTIVCNGHFTSYEPIPLTEHWLIRLGFSQSGEWWVLSNLSYHCDIHISLIHELTTYGDEEEHYIEHLNEVHKVQNFFYAVNNKELEINQ